MAAVACGIDWARDHHDVAIVDCNGKVVASERISDTAEGFGILLRMLSDHDPADGQLPIAIETSRGLLVAGLRAAGRTVFAINPFSVSRYRDRYRSSRGKSDAFDAMVLANILRTDIDPIGHCPTIRSRWKPCVRSRERSRTRSGNAPRSPTASGRC